MRGSGAATSRCARSRHAAERRVSRCRYPGCPCLVFCSMNLKAERVLASGDELGECPIWDERMAALWWVDILGRAIKRYDGQNVRIMPMPEMPGSIALRREGGMLVALESGAFLLGTGDPQLLARPPEHEAGLRFNDGRCDRAGRFWVGTLAEPD